MINDEMKLLITHYSLLITHYSLINSQLSFAGFTRDGDDRVRTDGLRLARAALSQLSYIPLPETLFVMGLGRVELPTSRLSGVRSNHLSYRPDGVRLGEMI